MTMMMMSERDQSSGTEAAHPRPDEISATPEPVNGPDGIAYSSASEKGHELGEKPQDYPAHEKSLDEESGNVGQIADSKSERRRQTVAVWSRKLKPVVHFLIWALWTM